MLMQYYAKTSLCALSVKESESKRDLNRIESENRIVIDSESEIAIRVKATDSAHVAARSKPVAALRERNHVYETHIRAL
ncbi:hypothetical protein EVAR_11312_1 [Eumeta japonica]|uniref:Uncharacterized protein n=1 Tax=Eumeta variegata TaxID=151549 RepID=A0A4C1U0R4_EUMVA|nr:hypothetical protein EVAR_11312_1 [Eumeta japonica]